MIVTLRTAASAAVLALLTVALLTAPLVAIAARVAATLTLAPQLTENGHYRVSLRPVPNTPPMAQLHHWVMHLETSSGASFVPSQLSISGGMPGHGHGLVSQPKVTRSLQRGYYLIEGMKFHMSGDWQLIVSLAGAAGPDRAVFDFTLGATVNASISATPQSTVTGSTLDSKPGNSWSASEIALMQSLSIDNLTSTSDPSNRFSNNSQAAELGQQLFFDQRLSASTTVSCASCHDPTKKFTDGLTKSFGTAQTARHSPSLLGVAQGRWFYWDGRRDSLWAQAITPIETPGEMDGTRVNAVRYVFATYSDAYQRLVGDRFQMDPSRFPADAGPYSNADGKLAWSRMQTGDRDAVNQAFANIGKFLAAYMETLTPTRSRFDDFVKAIVDNDGVAAEALLDTEERAGLRLFLDGARTQCLRCHNGPMLTNHGFHNIATGVDATGALDFGRMIGLQAALVDEFNCRGNYSDQSHNESSSYQCDELRFAEPGHAARGAFKVPSLRNVAVTAPYLHDGRLATLEAVVEFYTQVPDPSLEPHELPPLDLSAAEIEQLVAFLGTLTGT